MTLLRRGLHVQVDSPYRESPGVPPAHAAAKTAVSVVVPVKNEIGNIERCLHAAQRIASDIVLIDDLSSDGTQAAAEERGARVLKHEFESFAGQRNWAMENGRLQNEWVLHLDADEVLTPELAAEIHSAIASVSPNVAGFLLCRKMMLNGRWLKHGGTFPVWILRLVRRGRVRYIERGHGEGYEADGEIGRLKEPFFHYNFSKGIGEWLDKHNRYSSAEAHASLAELRDGCVDWKGLLSTDSVRRRRALKGLSLRLPLRPWVKFVYMYFFRMGFLDGMPGLTYCTLQAIYEYMICLKVRELKRRQKGLAM